MMESFSFPGHVALGSDLSERLRQALAKKGPGYVPRTQHRTGVRPKFTNRLLLETSPYLLQHAHNPVNWYPWGDEAFADARQSGKPVFLSIGYATCHWCHVMEEESFENEEVARFLNEHYIAIKVDREERPDVDAVYMSAVQSLTGSGGWPLSAWLTDDREPFYGGTYFPPRDGERGARRGFQSLLAELASVYESDRDTRVQKSAQALCDAVRQNLAHKGSSATSKIPGVELIANAITFFRSAFDGLHGGLRRAPKFPSNLPVRLLLRHFARTGNTDTLEMATITLEKMAAGGIYDQLGGGFHRYSTDARWLVPHFEKMLYDNALLVCAYAEAYQVTKRPSFARVVGETLDYVLREMTAPEGGFYSATDADSEGEEGKFFVWSEEEISAVLGPSAERFMKHYGVSRQGNFEGQNILCVERPDEAEWAALKEARQELYTVREKRIRPLRDEKILAAWNGLMIGAFALGGRVLGDSRYVDAAVRAAEFVASHMRINGFLVRSFKEGPSRQTGFLDDYAFLTSGLIDLYQATFDPRWLTLAIELSETLEDHFADENGAWFMTSDTHEKLIAREKPNFDGAEPSGTSVAILNALKLAALTSDTKWLKRAEKALACFAESLEERPLALTEMLSALDFYRSSQLEIAFVWPEGQPPTAFLDVLRQTYLPNHVVVGASENDLAATCRLTPLLEHRTPIAGLPTACLCEQGSCRLPTTEPAVFAQQLRAHAPHARV